jgi:MFS family permease
MAEYTETIATSLEAGNEAHLTESRWGWNQVVVAFLTGGLFQGLMIYCYSALMALIALDITATQTELMYPKTAMMAVGAIMAPVLGILVDRYSIKGFLILGVLIFGAGLAVVNTGDSILQLALIFAIFFGPLQVLLGPLTTSALVSRWFDRRRGLAIGVSNVGISTGAFLLPFLIRYLSTDLGMGWREIFPVLAIGVLVLTLPVILLLAIDKPDDYEQRNGAERAATTSFNTGMLLRDKGFWYLGVCVGIMYGLLVGILSNIVQIAMENGLDLQAALLALSWMAIGGVAGKLTVGYLSDRINNCLLLVIVLVIFSLSLLPPVLADGVVPVYLFSAVLGFSAISSLPLWHSLTARLFGVSNFARVIGLSQPIVLVMTMVGPLLVAKIYDITGSFDNALMGISVTLLVTTLLVFGIRAKEKQVEAEA